MGVAFTVAVSLIISSALAQEAAPAQGSSVARHVVESGETLTKLALDAYSDSSLYHLIVEFNDRRGHRIDSGKLQVGESVLLPQRDQLQQIASTVTPPRFRLLPDRHCSEYCRLAGILLFNVDYPNRPAWDFPSLCRSCWLAEGHSGALETEASKLGIGVSDIYDVDFLTGKPETLQKAIADAAIGSLEPHLVRGCVVGFYYTASRQNNAGRSFTHLALYVGRDKQGRHSVFHQFLGEGRVTPLHDMWRLPKVLSSELSRQVLVPRQVLIPRGAKLDAEVEVRQSSRPARRTKSDSAPRLTERL